MVCRGVITAVEGDNAYRVQVGENVSSLCKRVISTYHVDILPGREAIVWFSYGYDNGVIVGVVEP